VTLQRFPDVRLVKRAVNGRRDVEVAKREARLIGQNVDVRHRDSMWLIKGHQRLLGVPERIAAAARAVALHDLTLLAGLDAVLVALKDPFRNPSDDGCRVLCAFELLRKLCLKVCDV